MWVSNPRRSSKSIIDRVICLIKAITMVSTGGQYSGSMDVMYNVQDPPVPHKWTLHTSHHCPNYNTARNRFMQVYILAFWRFNLSEAWNMLRMGYNPLSLMWTAPVAGEQAGIHHSTSMHENTWFDGLWWLCFIPHFVTYIAGISFQFSTRCKRQLIKATMASKDIAG